MARKPMITRTIISTTVTVLCMDLVNRTAVEKTLVIPKGKSRYIRNDRSTIHSISNKTWRKQKIRRNRNRRTIITKREVN